MGIGGYILNCDHNLIRPFKSGGTGGDSAYPFQPDYLPNKFECGTPNIPGIIGLMEGIKFINKVGLQNIINKERELMDYALNKLSQIKNISIYGPKDISKILNVISFDIDNISSNELAYELDQEYEIMVRVGLHCAPTAHKIIGTEKNGTIRISIGYFNEKEDIDKLVISLNELIEKLT
jgi:selenocysteine lyase/cysteine desulfurase